MIKSLIFVLVAASFVKAVTVDIRAAWLDASQCPDEETTKQVISTMAKNGINRIYVGTWKNGKTFFNSSTLFNAISDAGIGRFIVPWAIEHGHAQNMEVYAWFEYGYIAAYMNLSTPFGQYANNNKWIMGEVNNMFYMNPLSDATEFLARMMIDAISLGIDGLQLDDHFSCRKKFLICSKAVIDNAAKRIYELIRKSNSTISISLAPAPLPLALSDYNVDWPELFKAGYFQEIVPLLYTSSYTHFEYMLSQNEVFIRKPLREKTLIGIMVNKDSENVIDWKEVKQMINLANRHKYGVTIWYGKSIVKDYSREFYELWGNKLTNMC